MRSTLLHSNPFLQDPALRRAALRISAASSSAVEGIRKPFAADQPLANRDAAPIKPRQKRHHAAELADAELSAKLPPVRG